MKKSLYLKNGYDVINVKICYHVHTKIYHIWKFDGDRQSRFLEIACTKKEENKRIIGGKKRRITTRSFWGLNQDRLGHVHDFLDWATRTIALGLWYLISRECFDRFFKKNTHSESIKGSLSSFWKSWKKIENSFFFFASNDDWKWRRIFSWRRYTSKTLDLSSLKMSALYLYSFLKSIADKIDFQKS